MVPLIKNLLGRRLLAPMMVFLFGSAVYLYAFPQPNVFYAVVVLLHALAGLVATIYLLVFLFGLMRQGSSMARIGWLLVSVAAILGIVLSKVGTSRSEWNWLYLHIILALIGSGILFAVFADRRGLLLPVVGRASVMYFAFVVALAGRSVALLQFR